MNWLKTLTLFSILLIAILFLFYSFNTPKESKIPGWNYEQLYKFSHNETNYSFSYSGDERDDEGNFGRMINSVNSNYPQLLFNINGGDLRSDASQIKGFEREYLEPGTRARLNRPVLFVIGNHEIEGDPSGSIYKAIFGEPTYFNFSEKNSYFILIDNANGTVNQTQMQWIQEQLQKSQKFKYRFVFMHLPLYSPHNGEEHSMTASGPGGADVLSELFDANNVTMIFASHVHNFYNGTWGKTPYIISGGAGAPPEENLPPNHHYVIINVSDYGISYYMVGY